MVEALIAALPPTLAAIAAWRQAAGAKANTNGALHGPLQRIEAKVDDLLTWQVDHEREHKRSA